MIRRESYIKALLKRLARFEVTAVLGPRQIGKTTLARQVAQAYGKANCRKLANRLPARA